MCEAPLDLPQFDVANLVITRASEAVSSDLPFSAAGHPSASKPVAQKTLHRLKGHMEEFAEKRAVEKVSNLW